MIYFECCYTIRNVRGNSKIIIRLIRLNIWSGVRARGWSYKFNLHIFFNKLITLIHLLNILLKLYIRRPVKNNETRRYTN